MKLANLILVLAALAYVVPARSAILVPPEEMLSVCNLLSAHVTHAVESSKSKVPLQAAVSMSETAMGKKLPEMPVGATERYRASVRELYERIYALPDANLASAYPEVIPACVSYTGGEHTAADLQEMKRCEAKARPYFGFANLRDSGISLAQQLEWLQREGLKNAPVSPEEKKQLYATLSGMIEYVYAHPELSRQTIYEEQFDSCIEVFDK